MKKRQGEEGIVSEPQVRRGMDVGWGLVAAEGLYRLGFLAEN